jgi:hypothetical protein
VTDGLQLDRVIRFAPADCVRRSSGKVTCKRNDADGTLNATFAPHGDPATSIRFGLRATHLQGLAIPFGPPLTVRITNDPPGSPAGIDRVGGIATCRVTANGMICRSH